MRGWGFVGFLGFPPPIVLSLLGCKMMLLPGLLLACGVDAIPVRWIVRHGGKFLDLRRQFPVAQNHAWAKTLDHLQIATQEHGEFGEIVEIHAYRADGNQIVLWHSGKAEIIGVFRAPPDGWNDRQAVHLPISATPVFPIDVVA